MTTAFGPARRIDRPARRRRHASTMSCRPPPRRARAIREIASAVPASVVACRGRRNHRRRSPSTVSPVSSSMTCQDAALQRMGRVEVVGQGPAACRDARGEEPRRACPNSSCTSGRSRSPSATSASRDASSLGHAAGQRRADSSSPLAASTLADGADVRGSARVARDRDRQVGSGQRCPAAEGGYRLERLERRPREDQRSHVAQLSHRRAVADPVSTAAPRWRASGKPERSTNRELRRPRRGRAATSRGGEGLVEHRHRPRGGGHR